MNEVHVGSYLVVEDFDKFYSRVIAVNDEKNPKKVLLEYKNYYTGETYFYIEGDISGNKYYSIFTAIKYYNNI